MKNATTSTALLIALLFAGCGATTTEADPGTTEVASAITRGGGNKPLRRTFLGRFNPTNAQWTL